MAITSAAIEANGWVLQVTFTGALSTAGDFSAYTLDPNGTPRLTLAAAANGFAPSGGVAVATTSAARALIATKPLRLPVQATAAGARSAKTPDETNLGGGSVRVRIALSEHVYAGNTGLVLTALAGWRTGEGAATIAVTNNSTLAAPPPIVRWSDVPYQRIGNTTQIALEVVAFTHHPKGLAPLAAVRFSVTDGTNTAAAWASALSTSTRHGDALRVYRVTIDGSTATPGALTEGLVRCDFKAFPWIGPARASDVADTAGSAVAPSNSAPSMTGLTTAAMAPAAQSPFVVAYDPNGTWLPPLYIYIEPNTWVGTGSIASNVLTVATTTSGAVAIGSKISGVGVTAGCTVVSGSGSTWTVTTTANVATIALSGGGTANNNICTVSSNPATASAGVCAGDYTTARNALKIQNRVVAARNGQAASATGATDGMIVRYKAGSYTGLGTTAVGSGISTNYTWEIVEGDPADSNPRANITVVQATGGNTRLTRVLFRNMTIVGPSTASFATSSYTWTDNVEVRGPSGNASNTTALYNTTGLNSFWTNMTFWQIGSTIGGQLIRNCSVERATSAVVTLNLKRLATAVAGTSAIAASGSAVDPVGATQDTIVANSDLRYVKSARTWVCPITPNASAGPSALGTTYPVFNRQVFANNVCESYGASNPIFTAIGENIPVVATWSIVEGNTLAGDRVNFFYDDLNLATIAANDTDSNIILGNRVANNAFDQHSIKTDFYNDAAVAAQRVGVALSTTRSRAYAVGAEIVIAGSPANVYRCITAGTTASGGGPSGTGADITDGTVHWAWFATETRTHGYRPNAVRGWSATYGVGFIDNVILRGNTDPEFVHEFEGLNTPNYTVDSFLATGTATAADPRYTLDKSGTDTAGSRYDAANTGGGDYKPLSGSPLIARSRSGNIDTDQRGVVRGVPFTSGAVQNDALVALVPASARQPGTASSPLVRLDLALAPASAAVATRAASPVVGWATVLGVASARQAMRAASPVVGWTAALVAASAVLASRAAASTVGWAATLLPDATRHVSAANAGRIDWLVALLADSARSATSVGPVAIDFIALAALSPGNTRLRVTDRTLPTLLPGSVTPPERTLIVTGDFRTLTVPAD